MIDHRINFLEDRLSRLERQNLFWKRVAIIPLLLMTSILLMGQVGRNHKVIEAEKFVIKDATGKTRVVLGLGPQPFSYGYGPDVYGVSLYASDGRHVASLSELAEGTGGKLVIQGKNTHSYSALSVSDGISSLYLNATNITREVADREDEEWGKKYNSAKNVEERRYLSSIRPHHGVSARLSAFPKGNSVLSLERGSSLNTMAGMWFYLKDDGEQALYLSDIRGTTRAALGNIKLERVDTGVVENRPISSLVFFDKKGKTIWKAP